jgi:hypothetical protein
LSFQSEINFVTFILIKSYLHKNQCFDTWRTNHRAVLHIRLGPFPTFPPTVSYCFHLFCWSSCWTNWTKSLQNRKFDSHF